MTSAATRIWVQSVTDLMLLPRYATQLEEHAARCARPGAVVDVHGVAAATYPDGVPPIEVLRYPAAEYLLGVQLLQNARRAECQNYDAFAVTCFFDPVLDELRSAVGIPVVSQCESALLMTTAAGARLGLIGIAGVNQDRLGGLVERYGFASRVAAVVAVEPPVAENELDYGYDDPTRLMPRFETAATRCAEAGADLLVPAEGVLNSMLTRGGVAKLAGLPVFDAFAALLAHADALVWLARTSGLSLGGRHGYAHAPADMMNAAASRAGYALQEALDV